MNTIRRPNVPGSLCFATAALLGCATPVLTPDDPLEALDAADAQARARRWRDAEQLTRDAPDNPTGWAVLAEQRRATGDTRGVVDAACRAATLLPSNAAYLEACGDAHRDAGNAVAAVEQWRRSILVSTDREQQFDLLDRISQTSLQPETDVQSLPPELVDQYRVWKWAQWHPPVICCPPWRCEPRPVFCGVR